MTNPLWLLVATLLSGYVVVALYLCMRQRKLIYHPEQTLIATPRSVELAYEEIHLSSADGVTLHAWFIPNSAPNKVVLFLHGNSGNMSHVIDTVQIVHSFQCSVLLIDYRGYGQSGGVPSEQGTYLDAEAAWLYLTQTRAIPANNIVVFGRSLGGAIATWLVARHSPRALIIESSFTSMLDLAGGMYPWLPVRWLSRIRYNSKDNLKSIGCPVLIVHSKDDEMIPFKHGQQLHDAVRGPKDFLEISGDHKNGHRLSGPTYAQGLGKFLEKI